MSEVEYEIEDGVAVLTLARGSANALSPEMRAMLVAALDRAQDDPAAKAAVLIGAGEVFCSGVDLAEFDAPLSKPWVADVAEAIEACNKPVVAALHGAALGAGFELALAAHGRVAQRGCRVALPEVSLGMVPGGGGTQRLPRLLGAQAALELLLTGRATPVEDPRLARIFTKITDTAPRAAALTLAHSLALAPTPPRTRDAGWGFSDPEAYQKAISAVAGRLGRAGGAERDILRCVEAAQLLPFDQGIAFEATVFADRLASDEARAIRHIYTAERRAAIAPAGPEPAANVDTVVIAGRDVLVAELAVFALDRRKRVAILSPDEATAGQLAQRVRAVYDGAVARERLKPEQRDERLSRLSHGREIAVLRAADLILDAGGMSLDDAPVKAGAIWAVMEGRAMVGDRHPAVLMRAYRPAHSAPVVEVAGLAEDVALATVRAFFGAAGRSVLRTVPKVGLLGHRLMGAGLRAALALVQAGADPREVDTAAHGLGFVKGPFEMIEAEGIAPVLARLHRLYGDAPELTLLAARGEAVARGETPGQGFYAAEGQALGQDNTLAPWLTAWWRRQGDTPAPIDVPLGSAFHAALVKAAAEMIEGKAVERALDIDLCFVKGYGFARDKGGPLLQADLMGVLGIVRAMKALAPLSEDIWGPVPLLDEMVKFGRGFFTPER